MSDDTKTLGDVAPPPPSPSKKPRKSFQYWGVFEGTHTPATPRGSKKYVEESAAILSDPTRGDGNARTVCLLKAPKGSVLGEATGVCYVNGVRQKRKKK